MSGTGRDLDPTSDKICSIPRPYGLSVKRPMIPLFLLGPCSALSKVRNPSFPPFHAAPRLGWVYRSEDVYLTIISSRVVDVSDEPAGPAEVLGLVCSHSYLGAAHVSLTVLSRSNTMLLLRKIAIQSKLAGMLQSKCDDLT